MTRIGRPVTSIAFAPIVLGVSLLQSAVAPHVVRAQAAPQAETREQDKRTEAQRRKDEEQKRKQEEQQRKNQTRLQETQAKSLREFENLKRFALDLQTKDYEFKTAVETAYGAKKREHSEFAFAMNTRDQDDEQVTRTGDTFKIEDTLYDNPLVQQYVNRLGQSVVPKSSQNLYVFRVTLNPVPLARALSTGTIYVSTGFISLADNEAQLAYILAHEIAHVEQEHWKEDVLMQLAQAEYAEEQQKNRKMWSRIASGAALGLGAAGAINGMAMLSIQLAVPTLLKLGAPGGVIGWDSTQEDQADRLALQYMVDRNYDPETVPPLYAKLAELAKTEKRATFGFIADPNRVAESERFVRTTVETLKPSTLGRAFTKGILELQPTPWETVGPVTRPGAPVVQGALRAAPELTDLLRAKLASGEIIADSGKFRRVMSELKRDNGIQAFYYDMFRLSLTNLHESLDIYADDPLAHFAFGRTLWLTARTSDDRGRAFESFTEAIKRDTRRVVPQARLFKALALIDREDPSVNPEIVAALKEYVEISRLLNAGSLPADMNAIYDSLLQAGDRAFVVHPSTAVWATEQAAIRPVRAVVPEPAPAAAPAPAPTPAPARPAPAAGPQAPRRPATAK